MIFFKILWHINCAIKKILLKIIYRNKIKFGKNVQFRKRFNLVIEKNGKVVIGDNTFFNDDCSINAMSQINIGKNCLFGENVKIYDHNHRFRENNKLISEQGYSIGKVDIGNNCWICSNTVILKDSNIKDNTVIGAGNIVDNIIEENTLVINKTNYEKIKLHEVKIGNG